MTDLAVQEVKAENFIDEWERQPDEPKRAFSAFVLYRDMLDERGVTLVRDRAGFNASPSKLMEWATRFRWVERANAWDRMLDRRRQAAHIQEIEAMARRQVHIGQTLQHHGLEYVKEQLATPEQRQKNLGANAALRYIDRGVELEREGLGLNDKEAVGDTHVSITVLDAQTKGDVFSKIAEMATNMAAVRAMMNPTSDESEIVDAVVVEDEVASGADNISTDSP